MKKLFIFAFAAMLGTQSVSAQDFDDYGIFDHLSAGISLGTTGIGIEVAAPVTNYLAVRAGYSFVPKIKVKKNIHFDSKEDWLKREDGTGYYDNTDIEAKLNMGDFKLLVDVYPFKTSSFRLTAGAYIGQSKLVQAKSLDHFVYERYWGIAGPELGTGADTYTIVSDKEGHINADLKVNSFKPYIGFGFGRAVPRGRIGVCFDMGVQFWGKPGVYTNISDDYGKGYQRVDRKRITNQDDDTYDDIKDGIKIGEKIIGYPVITLRINGRIF